MISQFGTPLPNLQICGQAKDSKPAFQLGLDADGHATTKSEMEHPVGITGREKWYIGCIITGLLVGGAYVAHRTPSPSAPNCAKGEVREGHSPEFQPLVTAFAALLAASIAYLAAMKSSLRTAKATAIAAKINAKTSRRKIDHEIRTDIQNRTSEIEIRRLKLLHRIISARARARIYIGYIDTLKKIGNNFGINHIYDHVFFRRLNNEIIIFSDGINNYLDSDINGLQSALPGIILAEQSGIIFKNYARDIAESRNSLKDEELKLALHAASKQIHTIERALYEAQKALDPEMKIGAEIDALIINANETA